MINIFSLVTKILTDAANKTGFIKEMKMRPSKSKANLNVKPVKRPWFNKAKKKKKKNKCLVSRNVLIFIFYRNSIKIIQIP